MGETVADDRRKISTTLKEVIRDDGIQGLWRGTVPTLVRYVSHALLILVLDVQGQ